MKSEAAVWIGVIMAVVMAALAFGYISWTEEQMTAFQQMLIVTVPALIPLLGAVLTRMQVFSQATVEADYIPKPEETEVTA